MSNIKLPGSRKVGHLTLVREARDISPNEFNSLHFDERLAMVRSVPGRGKYELLIEARDADELVKKLSPQEVYTLVREVGEEDVPDLVAMTSTEQLLSFVDLDAWRDGFYDGKVTLGWFKLLAQSGELRLWEALDGIDNVSLVLFFSGFVTVTGSMGDLLEEDRLQQGDIDKIFQVEYKDSEHAKLIGGYLDIIYRRDRDLYVGLMEMIRTEQGAELEELSLQQRNGRLLDMGIPDPEGAMAVYAWIDPERFIEQLPSGKVSLHEDVSPPVPGSMLTITQPGQLLSGLLEGDISEDLAWELTCLNNKVLVASKADLGDSGQVAEGLREVYDNLELALGFLCGNDLVRARQALDGYYLQHLFQLGFSLLQSLHGKAKSLQEEIGPFLDAPYNRIVMGLINRRPQFYLGMEGGGRDGMRSFASYEEVEKTGAVLEEIEVQRQLFSGALPFDAGIIDQIDLDGCNVESEDVTLGNLLMTALGNRLLGREFYPEPLEGSDLAVLHEKISQNGAMAPELRAETSAWLDRLVVGAETFATFCLDMLEEDFCSLEAEHLDARFVSGLIVRL